MNVMELSTTVLLAHLFFANLAWINFITKTILVTLAFPSFKLVQAVVLQRLAICARQDIF